MAGRKDVVESRKDRTLGGEIVDLEMPTETIKKGFRDATSHDDQDILGSYTGAVNRVYGNNRGTQDKVLAVTRFTIYAGAAKEFALVDRNGTFDYHYLESAGELDMIGNQLEPVMVTRGTFNVRMLGSAASGTNSVSFEGIVPRFGTEAISTTN